MNRPIQMVHVMEGGTAYSFDCVIKSEHSHTMDVLEDIKEAKNKIHTNYAVIKPSTLMLEVSVNDTVTVSGEPLTSGGNSRSESAYDNLYKMMYRRNFVTVITRMHTFSNMLLSDFVVTEDPDHQFEMYANVSFKEMIISAPTKKKGKTQEKKELTPEEAQSALYAIVGGVTTGWNNLKTKVNNFFGK